MWLAHTTKGSNEKQFLAEHLQNVAELAGAYAKPLALYWTAYLAGLLHDAGKYSDAFQTYLRRAQHGQRVQRGSVDHAYAGAKLIAGIADENYPHPKQKSLAALIIANAVMSHHRTELYDYIDPIDYQSPYNRRIDDHSGDHAQRDLEYPQIVTRFHSEICSDSELVTLLKKAEEEILKATVQAHQSGQNHADVFAWLNRYIYSCLIDADRTDTANFDQELRTDYRLAQRDKDLKKLSTNLTNTVSSFPRTTKIDKQRHDISETAAAHGQQWPTGMYRLTIPTGGGKTLASMRFALASACRNQQQSIIYSAPFISILRQNAGSVQKAVKSTDDVLEHHANIDLGTGISPVLRYQHDAWDAPIVMTTAAGFVNSILGSGSNNIRRFHRLCNSVLLVDEPQALPARLQDLFLSFLQFAVKTGHATVVYLTATQSALDVFNPEIFSNLPEIIPNYHTYERQMQRVHIDSHLLVGDKVPAFTAETLADYIANHFSGNLLVILNTISAVQNLTRTLKERFSTNGPSIWSLSTRLCPQHEADQLAAIRYLLDRQWPVIVVATPIIEAGVDISFKHCIRAFAGMDAIAQAAGRVNREGKASGLGDLILIQTDTAFDSLAGLTDLKKRAEITKECLARFKRDPDEMLTTTAQTLYFRDYYMKVRNEKITKYPAVVAGEPLWLYDLLNDGNDQASNSESLRYAYAQRHGYQWPYYYAPAWDTLSAEYQYIDDQKIGILVPYNTEAKHLIAELTNCQDAKKVSRLLKRAQRYVVGIYAKKSKNSKTGKRLPVTDKAIPLAGFDGQIYQLNPSEKDAYSTTLGLRL